jgi:predicted Ser/Thr protein kinase
VADIQREMQFSQQEWLELVDMVHAATRIDGVRFVQILGAGSNGIAVQVCDAEGQTLVLKILRATRESFEREDEMQRKFAAAGLAPRVYGAHFGDRVAFTLMDRVDGGVLLDVMKLPLSDRDIRTLAAKLVDLAQRMCDAGLSHNDFHFQNVGLVRHVADVADAELTAIDFGFSNDEGCDMQVDLAQVIRSTFGHSGTYLKNNMRAIRLLLINAYKARYGAPSGSSNDFRTWDALYPTLLNRNLATFRAQVRTAKRQRRSPGSTPVNIMD